jgi:ribosome-associated protein
MRRAAARARLMTYETPDPDDEAERPSKSSLKRAAHAAQALGEQLIGLRGDELAALELPERLLDAILEAQRTRSRGGLLRQRQYIGRLMRDIDTTAIEAALAERARGPARDVERLRRVEAWRTRLLSEGESALEALVQWRNDVDVALLSRLVAEATDARRGEAARTAASRALFRALRAAFDAPPVESAPPSR